MLPNAVRAGRFQETSRGPPPPLNARRAEEIGSGGTRREVEHSYLIDEALCKFYCAPARGVPEHGNLSRDGSESRGYGRARVITVFSIYRLQVCPTVHGLGAEAANGN